MGTIRTFADVHQSLARAYLYPEPAFGVRTSDISSAQNSLLTANRDTFVFQYFPETLSEQQSANYNSIDVPGGSHPIVQWINNGARQISFRSQFVHEQISPDGTEDPTNKHNVNIDAAVAWLRYFMYPHYETRGELLTSPPPVLYLVLGNHKLRHNSRSNASGIPVVMMDLSVEYSAWHADGTPRIAGVDFQFQEVIQSATRGVKFVDRDDFRDTMTGYRRPVTQSRRVAGASH